MGCIFDLSCTTSGRCSRETSFYFNIPEFPWWFVCYWKRILHWIKNMMWPTSESNHQYVVSNISNIQLIEQKHRNNNTLVRYTVRTVFYVLYFYISNYYLHLCSFIIILSIICLKRKEPSCSWSYGNWIYNCLCNQCLSAQSVSSNPAQAMCTRYKIMW